MRAFKNIFGRLWAIWGLVSFIITFLIFFIPSMCSYLIKDKRKSQLFFINVSRWWMNVWLPLVGCPVSITGREHFRKGENYIVVFNHNALLDVPLSAPYVPGANKTIAKSSFAKVPLFGLFYSKGSVLVDRKDEQSRVKSFEAMKQTLHDGMHMCIYPEGTRNRTSDPLKRFYDGAFKLATATGKDVIPCIISNTKKAMPIHKTFYLFPHPLKMKFLPPVTSSGETSTALRDKVYDIMLKELN